MEFLANLLESTNLGDFVNAHDWVWPLCEIFHFIGMAALIGTVGLVDLRILGFAKRIPIAALERLVPIGVAGFVVNAVTGFIFVAGNPVGGPIEYLENLSLQLKLLLILIAGINLLIYYFGGIARQADAVPPGEDAPRSAKFVAATSLIAWFGVIFFGRMIMYNDTLLYAFGL